MELSEMIAKSGCSKFDVIRYARDNWGISRTQAERYYTSACKMLMPDDTDKWRELMISRNFATLEELLHMAMERSDVKSAVDVVKAMNQMLGIGDRKVAVQTEDAKIIVSFGE